MMVRSRSVLSLLVLVTVVTVRVRAYQVSANSGSARCEEAGLCVECRGFHQPWLEFSEPHSAYHCFTSCQAYNFSYVDNLDESAGEVCKGSERLAGIKSARFVLADNNDQVDVQVQYDLLLEETLEVSEGLWLGSSVREGYSELPHGWGILNFNNDDQFQRLKFEGNMVNGVMEGYGTLWWQDGSHYTGQFHNNMKDQFGAIFYANGDIFSGSWSEEKKNTPSGMYMFGQGGVMEGSFIDGKVDGMVTTLTIEHDGEMDKFSGNYEAGTRVSGKYEFSSGDVYQGAFKSLAEEALVHGKYVWACGKTYEGTFRDGKPHGDGVMTYPQGWKYEGQFQDGKFHGVGKFSWSEINFYEGQFAGGEMTGVGVYALEDGGLFDSSSGVYYPDSNNKADFHEAHFDGKILRYKKADQSPASLIDYKK